MESLTKNQRELVELFRSNVFLKSTILELMKKLKKKSYQRVHEAVKFLEKEKILKITKVGKSSLVELARTKESAIILAYIEEKKAVSEKIPNIEEILNIPEMEEDILIITGSYANRKEKKNSDLDLVVITKEDAFKKSKLIDNRIISLTPEVHVEVFTQKDFESMLLSKESNFGKEVFLNHLIFKNARRFYELVFKTVNNGFSG